MISAIHKTRRGIASVLAMTYLVLFSALAVGFFAATTMSVQISDNDMHAAQAQKAAESGLQYIRWELDNVTLLANSDFTADPVFTNMYGQLSSMNPGISADNRTIYIPALSGSGAPQWISLDGQLDASSKPIGAVYTATLQHVGDKFLLKVTGRNGSTTVLRAIQLSFQELSNSSTIFDYGLVSKGKIATSGSAWVEGVNHNESDPLGSVLSTDTIDPTPVTIAGRGVSGDISIVSNGTVTYNGASVVGTTVPAVIAANHVHKDVLPPDFPDVDTTAYQAFATNTFSGAAGGTFSGQTYTNITIPANKNPTFAGNTTINGVMVIVPPNVVKFLGNVKITGVIVAPSTPGGSNPAFNDQTNQIVFSGNVTAKDVSNLDPSVYGNILPTMTGAFILAPSFSTSFSGSFGTVNGSIIAGQVGFSGAASGTIQGSIIATAPQTSIMSPNTSTAALSVGGSADVIIAGRGTNNVPTGVSFGDHLVPLPGTYDEVMP